MARPKVKPTILHTGKEQLLQLEFLAAVNKVCPEVIDSLYQDVFARKSQTVDEWSCRFHVSSTWIEGAARSTLNVWALHPMRAEARLWSLHSVTRDAAKLPDAFAKFQVSLSVHLSSLLAAEATVNAYVDDAVQKEKDRLKRSAIERDGASTAVIPSDVQPKMECAALYVCRGMSPRDIGDLREYAGEKTRIYRSVQQILALLKLPMKPVGRPRKTLR